MYDQPEIVTKDSRRIAEAIGLCAELLKNVELQEVSLSDCALKAARLSRLIGDADHQKVFALEASGYSGGPDGLDAETFGLAVKAGRGFLEKDAKTGAVKHLVYVESISSLEAQIKIADSALAAAKDPNVSISSANPQQWTANPHGNAIERNGIRNNHFQGVRRLAERRTFLYNFATETYYSLRVSEISDDVFVRNRGRVDNLIGALVPDATHQLISVHDNLASANPEDWANAVHSCRRVLQAMADRLFPPTDPQIRGGRTVKMGPDNYINRLVAFIEDHSASTRFEAVVGSTLSFIGDRLDAVFGAAQKGSHAHVTREEAERYVIYTYLLAGDILSLQG